jgi:hypothetical protein
MTKKRILNNHINIKKSDSVKHLTIEKHNTKNLLTK